MLAPTMLFAQNKKKRAANMLCSTPQTVDKPHFTPEQPNAFPLRGRWREAPDEVEHVTNSPEVSLKCGIFPHTSSVGLEADSFPSRGSLGCSFF